MSPEEASIESLRRWSHFLFWVSIVLPILGVLAAGARYYVERYEKRLSARLTEAAMQRVGNEAAEARAQAANAQQAHSRLREDLARSQQDLAALQEKTAPRRLSTAQRQAIIADLKHLKGQTVAVACRMMDGESCDFAHDIATAIRDAGCKVPSIIKTSVNDFPGNVVLCRYGVADIDVMRSVERAFIAAAIPVSTEAVAPNSVGMWYPDTVHVIVGRKAP